MAIIHLENKVRLLNKFNLKNTLYAFYRNIQ